MNKIWLIIFREYLVRVRKKSFIIMTILAPLLLASIMVIPIYLANESKDVRIIAVSEKDKLQLKDTEYIHFTFIPQFEAEILKQDFDKSLYYALLEVKEESYTLFSDQQISLNISNEIKAIIEESIEILNLKEAGIDPKVIKNAKRSIKITTRKVNNQGTSIKSSSEISHGVGFTSGILIYMFIFMYGTMVMRGVIEEKTNRIVEVIISSVKPFQLMMGKILGVALVGLTQFILWIILTIILASIAEFTFLESINTIPEVNTQKDSIILAEISSLINGINLVKILISFLFFFLTGYLMYSSMFAAIGSAVDSESDTQQFILPVTLPLILSFILIQPVMDSPDGLLAFWMSIIPLTSPIIMMVRLPFGVDNWELILSMLILVGSFIVSTWIAGRIYRTGILMYGKKASYKELWKWLKH